jgi:ubiquinone/menaquinone biosynthesis C-methylase UbiE
MRRRAREAFTDDYQHHPGGYVPGSLPNLPFSDRCFDLALCSHFLFTWSDVFDEAWHETSLLELSRVAAEVRVFPLVVQGSGAAVRTCPP